MSKWVKAKVSQLSNIENDYFFKAIDKMGYKADFSQKKLIRSFERDAQNVDCVLVDKNTNAPSYIGLCFTTNEDSTVNMTIVTDNFYSRVTTDKFSYAFTLEYNTVKYTSVAESMNFQVESTEVMADGRRKIVMKRCA